MDNSLYEGNCPLHYKMYSNIPDFHLLVVTKPLLKHSQISLKPWVIFHCKDRAHFAYTSSVVGHLDFFSYLLTIMNNATVNIHVQGFLWA